MDSISIECRYCFSDEDQNDLIKPCKCEGSMRFVHIKCLKDWISNKGSTEVIEDGNVYYHLTCEVCKHKIKYFKEYENGLFISLLRTIKSIIGDLRNLSIFLVQFMLIFYFLRRMQNIWYNENLLDLGQKNFLNVFHEFVIFMSLIFGINDIFKYYNTILTQNRNLSLKFSCDRMKIL
jgi:hypothetical protein